MYSIIKWYAAIERQFPESFNEFKFYMEMTIEENSHTTVKLSYDTIYVTKHREWPEDTHSYVKITPEMIIGYLFAFFDMHEIDFDWHNPGRAFFRLGKKMESGDNDKWERWKVRKMMKRLVRVINRVYIEPDIYLRMQKTLGMVPRSDAYRHITHKEFKLFKKPFQDHIHKILSEDCMGFQKSKS